MVVRAAYQNAAFFQIHIFYQFKVFFGGTNPTSNFREFQSLFLTGTNGFAVIFAVKEKFTGSDFAFGTAQTA